MHPLSQRLLSADRALERALGVVGVAGSGIFVATVLHGRSVPLFPSLAWALTALLTWLVTGALWWLAWRVTAPSGGHAAAHAAAVC